MISEGESAPNAVVKFTSKSESGESFNLEDAYEGGTTILYFYPASFSEVCTDTNCELNESTAKFSKFDANVMAISTDLHFTHEQFIRVYDIDFPILSDYNREAINAFGVVDDNYLDYYNSVAKRSVFVIKGGIVKWSWSSDDPYEYPPFDKLEEVLAEL